MIRVAFLAFVVAISGCASNSGVVPLYGDVLTVSHQGATGASSPTALRQSALAEAQTHCGNHHQQFQMVELVEAHPPFILGNFPKAEVRFRCVSPS